MQANLYAPSSILSPVVRQYECIRLSGKESLGSTFTLTPGFECCLLFSFASGSWSKARLPFGDEAKTLPPVTITSPITGYARLTQFSQVELFRVILRPGMVQTVFGQPWRPFRDVVACAHDLDKELETVYQQLAATSTDGAKVRIMERYLFRKLHHREVRSDFFAAVLNYLRSTSPSDWSAEGMARHFGKSTRHFNRIMQARLGFATGEFLRIHRINGLLNCLLTQPGDSLTQVAYRFGFADQSHCIKSFHRMVGMTPGRYLKQVRRGAQVIPAPTLRQPYGGFILVPAMGPFRGQLQPERAGRMSE